MAGETIVVVDGGQDIDERMTTVLETESYMVYPVSSQEVNAELAELLKPSLIYIKPLELSPTGLKSCKAIHEIPLLKKVPVIILTSLKKELAPDYFRDYGIVDFLEPTFGPEELIEKTGTILDKAPPSLSPKEDDPVASPKAARKIWEKRSALLRPAIGVAIFLAIVGAAFLAYQQFMPTRKVSPPPKLAGPLRVPSKTPETGSKSQSPPEKIVVETPAPASPGAESKTQLSPGKTAAETPAPASSVTTAPPEAGPKPQLSPGKSAAGTPAPASPAATAPPGAGAKPQLPPEKIAAGTPKPLSPVPSSPPGQPPSLSSKPASQSPRKPFYSAQLGAFRNEDTAQALTKKLREKGYDAFTHLGVTKDGSPIYRVLVGKFDERMAARKLGREIQSKEEIETVLYGE